MKQWAIGAGVVGLGVAGMSLAVAARRERRIELKGRVAIVTGGGRGLGLAITCALLDRGCRVAICGRDGEVIERAVAALSARGADVMGQPCDASDPEQAGVFVQAVVARYGAIDLLVNNAGQCFVGPAVELQASDMEYALRHIFWAQYHPTMAVLPHMRRRGFGRIANITSIGGKLPLPHQAAYVAGKYAATGWSQTLAAELAKENIAVSTITPPPLRNGAPLHVHFNGREQEEFAWFTRALTSRASASSAERTAAVVVEALERGQRERAVSAGAWLAARLFGVAPNVVSRSLSWVDRRLPPPGPHTSPMQLGAQVAGASTQPGVRALAERARADEARYLPAAEA